MTSVSRANWSNASAALTSALAAFPVNEVDSAATLRREIENWRLVDQSVLYVEDVGNFDSAQADGNEMVNGIESERFMFIDEDAANLFLIKPPATSTATLWTAADGGFVTRYRWQHGECVAHL